MTKEGINKLIAFANELDSKGLLQEASVVDATVKKAVLLRHLSAAIEIFGADAETQGLVDSVTRALEQAHLPVADIDIWKTKTAPSTITLDVIKAMILNDEFPIDVIDIFVPLIETLSLGKAEEYL